MYCIQNMWSFKYLEFHEQLWGGPAARLKGLGGIFGHLKFSRTLSLHHLLGKALFPTGWECICCASSSHVRKIKFCCPVVFSCCFDPCLDEQESHNSYSVWKTWKHSQVSAGNHLCVSKLAFPELNLFILIWPPHPCSGLQTQLFPCGSVQAQLTSLSVLSLDFKKLIYSSPLTILQVSLTAKKTHSALQGAWPYSEYVKCLGKERNSQ